MPFAIAGPHIQPGSHVRQVTGNIDIAPTMLDIGGLAAPTTMDGESLLPLAEGRDVPWRRDFLVEKGDVSAYDNADGSNEPGTRHEFAFESKITKFVGAVDKRYSLVEYNDGHGDPLPVLVDGVRFEPGEEEFYDTRADPLEVHNLAARPKATWTPAAAAAYARLKAAVLDLVGCAGAAACRVQD